MLISKQCFDDALRLLATSSSHSPVEAQMSAHAGTFDSRATQQSNSWAPRTGRSAAFAPLPRAAVR